MTRDEIFDLIVRCTREVVPGLENRTVQRSDSLRELGANSVERAEIVMMVLNAMSLRIARTEAVGPRNIGELADLLHEKQLAH
jgi:polyketide biosynthesis acyl carrier protein